MDKRSAWLASALSVVVLLGFGGIHYSKYHGQTERLNSLQEEMKVKDNQVAKLTDQLNQHLQSIQKLNEQLQDQQKKLEEVEKKANF